MGSVEADQGQPATFHVACHDGHGLVALLSLRMAHLSPPLSSHPRRATQGKQPDNAEDFGRAIQSILAEKFTGISIELGSGVRTSGP